MALLKDLANSLQPLCEGAPDVALIAEYRRAAQDFFERTTAWRKELTATVAATANQVLTPPTDAEVYGVTRCILGPQAQDTYTVRGPGLERMTDSQYRRDYGVSYSGAPVGFRFDGANTIVLMPAPTSAGDTLTAETILRPTDTSTTLDDAMATRYSRFIADGATARLLRLPKKPWTNYQLAEYYEERFQEAVDRQSVLGPDGGVGQPRRVRYGGIR